MKTMTFGKKTYTQPPPDHSVYELINSVIEEREVMTGGANICAMFIRPNVTPTTVARIMRATNEMRFLTGYDYIIEISQEVWERCTEDVRRIIMWHELRHIRVKENEDGTYDFQLVQHNVQDFEAIIKEYGIDWFTTIKSEILELYANDAGIRPKDDPEVQREKAAKLAEKRREMGDRITL